MSSLKLESARMRLTGIMERGVEYIMVTSATLDYFIRSILSPVQVDRKDIQIAPSTESCHINQALLSSPAQLREYEHIHSVLPSKHRMFTTWHVKPLSKIIV